MHIGKKIRLIRNLRGYTQDELAEKVNKTRALISHIEQSGKVNFYTLQALSKALHVSIDELENFNEKLIIANEGQTKYGKSEIDALKQQLESCRKENETLKELVVSQKKIIEMMEKKKKK